MLVSAALTLLVGLVLVVVAVAGLLGPWWAALVAGALLIALAFVLARAPRPSRPAEEARR